MQDARRPTVQSMFPRGVLSGGILSGRPHWVLSFFLVGIPAEAATICQLTGESVAATMGAPEIDSRAHHETSSVAESRGQLSLSRLLADRATRTTFIPIPLSRQIENYTCGPTAMQAILGYYGVSVPERVLAKAAKSDPNEGTYSRDLIRVAKRYGFTVEVFGRSRPLGKQGPERGTPMTMEALEAALDRGEPVLTLIQAWTSDTVPNWRADMNDGHFVVVTGHSLDSLIIMDPSTLGSYVYVPKAEFMDRWHDIDGPTFAEGLGIIFRKGGARPVNPDAVVARLPGGEASPLSTLTTVSAPLPRIFHPESGLTGPTALAALLARHGIDPDFDQIASSSLWTSAKEGGTAIESLALSAQTNGMNARRETGLDLARLRTLVGTNRTPVLVALRLPDSQGSLQERPQYVVVVGVTSDHVIFLDPTVQGTYVFLGTREFATRLINPPDAPNGLWVDQPQNYDPDAVGYMR